MLSLDFETSCVECHLPLVDAGDEFACPSCGIVKEKEVLDNGGWTSLKLEFGRQALGSFMGSVHSTEKERHSRGFSRSNSTYGYLKVVSDFAGKGDGAEYVCSRMIRRIGEKLFLPDLVVQQAANLARKILATRDHARRVTIASVSAYSLVAACKIEAITSVTVREIVDAHNALGRRVTASSIIQLALESPIKTAPRRPEDYVAKVIAKLSLNQRLVQALSREGLPLSGFLNSLRSATKDILAEIDCSMTVGRRPCALAASAVYSAEMVLARREARKRRITQRDLAECGDSAEYTIRGQVSDIFMPAVERLVSSRRSQPVPSQR